MIEDTLQEKYTLSEICHQLQTGIEKQRDEYIKEIGDTTDRLLQRFDQHR